MMYKSYDLMIYDWFCGPGYHVFSLDYSNPSAEITIEA